MPHSPNRHIFKTQVKLVQFSRQSLVIPIFQSPFLTFYHGTQNLPPLGLLLPELYPQTEFSWQCVIYYAVYKPLGLVQSRTITHSIVPLRKLTKCSKKVICKSLLLKFICSSIFKILIYITTYFVFKNSNTFYSLCVHNQNFSLIKKAPFEIMY